MVELHLCRVGSSSSRGQEGFLQLRGVRLCDTLEPPCGGLSVPCSVEDVQRAKKAGFRAIPYGRYLVELMPSGRFSGRAFYRSLGGLLPRLQDVCGFSGVLIHCGNTSADTQGCILVGRKVGRCVLGDSRKTFEVLMRSVFLPARKSGESVWLTVERG